MTVSFNYGTRPVMLALSPVVGTERVRFEVERWIRQDDGQPPVMPKTGSPTENGESVRLLPTEYALHQNYPNPFNPSTQLDFDLPCSGSVALVIYDMLGQKVAELARGFHEAGYYTITWNVHSESGAAVASGVYLARFTVTDELGRVKYSKTSKMLLMK